MENLGTRKPNQTLTYCMAMVAVVSWAANYPATRYVLPYFSPLSIAMMRFLVATIILVIIAVVKKTRLPDKRDIPMFVLCGFCGLFLFTVLLNVGVTYVVSGVGSFIINSTPIFTLILSRLFLKEVVKPACWFGILLSFCGLAAVMASQMVGFSLNIGVFLLLFGAVAQSSYNVIQRGLLKRYTFFEAVLYSVIPANVFFFLFIPNVVSDLLSNPPLDASLVLILIGIFPGAVAYLTWGYALSKAEKTAHITVFLYLTPFIAALLGFLWLGETMAIWAFIGGVVIIAGMVMTNTLGKSR